MSSTRRGAIRSRDDLYETPEWFTAAIHDELLRRLPPEPAILEPAAGNGRMVKVLKAMFPGSAITARDINGFGESSPQDFLVTEPDPSYDLIITNPPFSYAQEFVEHALKFRRGATSVVAMVMRLNFLGSRKRATWFRERMPDVYVTPCRPRFVPKGSTGKSASDSCEYAWFLWQEPWQSEGKLALLHTESRSRTPMFGFTEEDQAILALKVAERRKVARTAVIPFG